MHLTPGGKNLDSAQAADLAVFAFATGLNPFNNECYYMDKIGPVPGIAGYRTKAQEWITATSHRLDYAVRLTEDYRQATTDEADFDPDKGDVAWVCILTDNVSKLQWEQRLVTLMSDYRKLGATFEESRKAAKEDVGACPSWTAVGVVHADEHFSGFLWENNIKTDKYKPEAWDRNERAKKRAAKGCYRKGFPQVRIPDREYGDDVVDSVAVEVKDRLIKDLALEAEKPHRPAADVIAELYGETPVQKEQPATEVKAVRGDYFENMSCTRPVPWVI